MTADRLLLWLTRVDACIVLCALPCALLPFDWMNAVHRDLFGLGDLPDAPITRYLARSVSLLYALHGALVLAVTLNWPRYRDLVPVLAAAHAAFGVGLFLIDLEAGMPWWWAFEGPAVVALGVVQLLLYRRATQGAGTDEAGPLL